MELITAKMARFAPRQIATVASAVTVNAGDLRSWRRANLRSVHYHSARKASIGSTHVARRAGTKQEAAATSVSNPATAR